MSEIKHQRVGSYALILAEGYVLLSLLNRGPNRGKWALVGGGVEFGESPRDALLREIKEEAGIDLTVEPVLIDVFSHEHTFHDEGVAERKMHFIGIIHTVHLPNRVPHKTDGDGSSSDGTKWFKLDELKLEELNPSVVKILKKIALKFN